MYICTYSYFFVSFLFRLVAQLLVLLVHETSHVSVGGLARVVLLDPDEAARRAIGAPERVERPDHRVVVAVRFAELGHVGHHRFVVVLLVFVGETSEHVTEYCIKSLIDMYYTLILLLLLLLLLLLICYYYQCSHNRIFKSRNNSQF